MNPASFNTENLVHGAAPDFKSKMEHSPILQRADFVFSRLSLNPGEVLLVKLAAHMRPCVADIKNSIDSVFKKEGDRVIVFFEDEIEFTKYTPSGSK